MTTAEERKLDQAIAKAGGEASKGDRARIEAFMQSRGMGAPNVPIAPVIEVHPAAIARTAKHCFRSRPGTFASFGIRIPALPPETFNEKKDAYYRRQFEKKYGAAALARSEAIKDRLGSWYIQFQTVHQRNALNQIVRECVYQTDDDEIAAFIWDQIKGDARFYQDIAPLTITIAGTTVDIPLKDEAQRAAVLAALQPQGAPTAVVDDRLMDKNGRPLTGKALQNRLAKLGLAA